MLRACPLAACLFAFFSLLLPAAPAQAQDADALRARHAALRAQLADSPFGRPLHVQSSARSGEHTGEVFALLEEPYRKVAPALAARAHWCDIVILQTNVKHCEASDAPGADTLAVFIARKPEDPLRDAYRVRFRFELAGAGADHLQVALTSAEGPFGTSDYAIRLQAAPLDARRTVLHMSYSYTLGFLARLAMDAYLATSGRDKVGFSVVERRPDGRPVYVDGVRGVIERNTMRYYLAVEAFLGSLQAPRGERLETRLRDWHAAIERYPLQLQEMERDEYLELKRVDVNRRAVGAAALSG